MNSLSVPKVNDFDEEDIEKEMQRLMDTYGNDVLRTSFMYLKDLHKAEDAFQEVFIKVFNNYCGFKGESSEKTWLIKITINVCNDMLRSSWLKRVLLTDRIKERSRGAGLEDGIIKTDENRLLFNKVLSLQPQFKEVIILYYYHSYDTAEISKLLDIPEGTVRSRLHRAREMLKDRLGGMIGLND